MRCTLRARQGDSYDVCGFGNSAHSYDFLYPGKLENCEGCHNPGTYHPVEPGTVLGTTVDVGLDATSPTDDVVISPTRLSARPATYPTLPPNT